MAISVTMVAFNCNRLDYCIEAAIRSSLTFADEVVVNEGYSSDDTYDTLVALQEEFGKDIIRLYRRKWLHNRGWQEKERNFAIDQAKGDWLVIQDADDLFHEKDSKLIKDTCANEAVNLINFEVLHFYGLPIFTNPNPKWYHRHTRIGRKSAGFKIKNTPGGCVSDVVFNKGLAHTYKGSGIVHLPKDSPIYHYGWVRCASVAGIKLNKFRSWYEDNSKYFDGYLDDKVPFDYRLSKFIKDLDKFEGTHPDPFYKWYSSKNRLINYNPEVTDEIMKYKANPNTVGMDFGIKDEEN